jgi:hypothetical protein
MLFTIVCTDKPGSADIRESTRAAHRDYLVPNLPKLIHAGAQLDLAGKPCGSLFIIEVTDRAEAEKFSAGDPYFKAGLFESVEIRTYRASIRDGVRVN